MVTSYIIILAVSAWICAFGVLAVSNRLSRLLKLPPPAPGMVALLAALGMLVVVAAPIWLFLALLGLALLPRFMNKPSLRVLLLIAALPLAASPLLGAATGFALDGLLIGAAVLGESHAA